MPKIKIDPFCALWLIFILYSMRELIIPLALSILLHELGHIIASVILKVKIKCLTVSLLGARLEISDEIPYLHEMLISLAGPMAGFLAFILTINTATQSQTLLHFCVISLALSIFNMFPISTLDGGRVLRCLLCCLCRLDTAEKIMRILTFFTLFFFWLISTYIMIKISSGLSGFVFCTFFFLKSFILNEKN